MNEPTPRQALERAARSLIKATADLGTAKRDLERAKERIFSRGDEMSRAEKAMTAAAKEQPAAGFLTILDGVNRSFVIRYDPAGSFEIHEARTVLSE